MKRKFFLTAAAVLFASAAVCSVILFSVIRNESGKSGLLEVYYFNVGQGDSSLTVFPDGTTVMTDTGSGGGFLPEYIRSLGIRRIDCLILTHPHSDHVGGAGSIAERFDIGMVITNGEESDLYSYTAFLEAAERKNIPVKTAKPGLKISAGGGEIAFLAPSSTDHKEENDNGAVMKLTYGGRSFLYMADCGHEIENELLESGADLDCDVIKLGHHGSSSATSDCLLDAASPLFAVVSCEKNNEYGHPDPDTVRRCEEHGAEVLATYGCEYAVIISTDGKDLIEAEAK